MIITKSKNVINIDNGKKENGIKVNAMNRHNGYNQKWFVEFKPDGAMSLKNFYSDKCIDNSGSKKSGSGYVQWDCNQGNDNQLFHIIDPKLSLDELSKLSVNQKIAMKKFKVPSGWFSLLGATGLCLTDNGIGKNASQRTCLNNDNTTWKFVKVSNEIYNIKSISGVTLTNSQSINKNGNPIISWNNQNMENQKWQILPLPNGKILIRNPESKKCIDVDGDIKENAIHQLYQCATDKNNQQFALRSINGKLIQTMEVFPTEKKPQIKKTSNQRKSIWDRSRKNVNSSISSNPKEECTCKNHKNPFKKNNNKGKTNKNKPKNNFKAPKGFFNILGQNNLCIVSNYEDVGNTTQGICGDYSNALWQVIYLTHDVYTIVSKNGFALENKDGKKNINNPITSNKYKNAPNQKWNFKNIKGGKIMIINVESKYCLDVYRQAKLGNSYSQSECLEGNEGEHFIFRTPSGKKIDAVKKTIKRRIKILKKKISKKIKDPKKKERLVRKYKKLTETVKKIKIEKVAKKIIKKKIEKLNEEGKINDAKKLKEEYKKNTPKKVKVEINLPRGFVTIVTRNSFCISNSRKPVKTRCSNNQKILWEIIRIRENEFNIKSKEGYYLTNKNGINKSGNEVIAKENTNPENDYSVIWSFTKLESGEYVIYNTQTKLCLDTTNKTNRGSGYKLRKCKVKNNITHQFFSINAVIPENSSNIKSDPEILQYAQKWINIVTINNLCIKSTGDGLPLEQSTCKDSDLELWQIVPLGENLFYYQNKAGFVISISNSAKNPKSILSNNITESEKFTVINLKGGRFMIKNLSTDKCLDIDGKPKKGGLYEMFKCKHNHETQTISFKLPTTVKVIRTWINIVGNNFLCYKNNGIGKEIVQEDCNNTNEMLWKFEVLQGDNFVIVSKMDNSVLDILEGKTFKGNYLITQERNNSKSQVFNIQNLTKGKILIRNQFSGKCIDNSNPNQLYRLEDCNKDSQNQLIRLEYPRPGIYIILFFFIII